MATPKPKPPAPSGELPAPRADKDSHKDSHDLAPRASFPLVADKSRINVAKLQDKSKDQLRQLFSDPTLPEQLGLSPLPAAGGAQAPAGEGFPPQLCLVVFDAVNMIIRGRYAALGARAAALGIPDALKADGSVKTAKLIDKYAPNSLGKYQIEADFGLWLAAVLAANVAIIRAPAQAPAAPAARQAEPAQEQAPEPAAPQHFPALVNM